MNVTISLAEHRITRVTHSAYTIDKMGTGKYWDGYMAPEDIDYACKLIEDIIEK